jgi:hypothetical protein
MNQRLERIEGCHPMLRRSVLALIESCEQKLKKKLLVVSGFRTVQEQMLIFQKGRTWDPANALWVETEPQAVVTRSLPGLSAHNVVTTEGKPASMGVDLIPFDVAGQPDWHVSADFWDQLYELAWKVGLDPLGDPTGSYLKGDLGHFEEPAWKLKLDGLGCFQPVQTHQTTVRI